MFSKTLDPFPGKLSSRLTTAIITALMNYETLFGVLLTNPNPMTASEVMIAGRLQVQSGTVAVHLRQLR